MGLASKLPTRADLLVLAEYAALPIRATLQSPNYRCKKAPFFRTRLLNNGRGGPGWRSRDSMGLASKLPTRADLLVVAESAALPIRATLQSPNYRCKKAPFFRTRLLNNGRGGEIRTPNTRIWNPLLCQLELHPCSSCLMRRLSNKWRNGRACVQAGLIRPKVETFKLSGGVDGTRTRDPRRDRPVF